MSSSRLDRCCVRRAEKETEINKKKEKEKERRKEKNGWRRGRGELIIARDIEEEGGSFRNSALDCFAPALCPLPGSLHVTRVYPFFSVNCRLELDLSSV